MDINELAKDGFSLKNFKEEQSDFAFLSLNIALKSYANTYRSFLNEEYGVIRFLQTAPVERKYPHDYILNCSETIIHLHHFFELVLKSVLVNQKLVSTAKKQKQLSFYCAITILDDAIEKKSIDTEFHFSKKHIDFLKILNGLRNPLQHRGEFILHYEAFDLLMVDHAIPLINWIYLRKFFRRKGLQYSWRYKAVNCGLDPLTDLAVYNSDNGYELKRAALMKEMIRAAFENPLDIEDKSAPPEMYDIINTRFFAYNPGKIDKAKNLANYFMQNSKEYDLWNMIDRIAKCPVCGVETLLVYYDYSDPDMEEKQYYKVKCTCCTFEINNELDILDDYDLNIENPWK